ncbi:ABC transporter ATP-binding protein [Papillibacter cinnamivorans]|uniref:ATP-binding cassette, subfamily B n=1 Tax=Papillibacter cinnamivorans DSM 12816 TaxID=1122930 RepID=A0A1W1ZL37_9FIRM|nr:ABC transporter ATP-binding protein [Papillibacter cinnamivorans]SMC49265.1 ATP-binding cassette, subfamily B [Papillibacter cinnamivorans DSM 12816]
MNIYGKYFARYRFLFIMAVLCVLLEAACDLLQPTVMARIIDDGIKYGSVGTVIRYGLLMLSVTALGACFAAVRNILASRVSQSVGADLRGDVFEKILRFSEAGADKIESGSLITRMTNDTSQVTQFVNGLMRIYVKAPITCAGSIVLAVLLSPSLSTVLWAVVAVVALWIVISMKLSYVRFARMQAAIDKVNTVVQEYLMGVRLVKAFGRFESEEERFEEANGNLADRSVSSQLVFSYFSPLMSLSVNVGIVMILYFGSLLFQAGSIEVGRISAFISYMAQILLSLIMITNIFNTLVRTKASTGRIREILDSGEDFPADGETFVYGEEAGVGLEFENVTFSYPGGSGIPAVKNLSFSVNPGETLAVIGPTGSGKSTLAWLCLRFYDVDSGSIRINGRDIRSVGSGALRKSIALAPQKSMLFSGTVSQNIAWGNPEASPEEISKAAKAAQADGFINEMPQKYESLLGQGAINLSGGQKQRLSIARALVSRAPVLILDDCTSALDAVTEAKVRRAVSEESARDKRTVILITQRIGTAVGADRILVLENGERVGFGSHRELMDSCRVYREIYDSQIGGDR